MKNKKTDIDIGFLGGLGPLTKEEEQALNEYFRAKKSKKLSKARAKTFAQKKVAA